MLETTKAVKKVQNWVLLLVDQSENYKAVKLDVCLVAKWVECLELYLGGLKVKQRVVSMAQLMVDY